MRVFVSYRRSDSRHAAGRLRDHLADAFGEDNIFFDVDSIDYGVDFREVIRETVRQSDAVVVVIGPRFDVSRLTQEQDVMRLELTEALSQKKRIVPVLVEDATMPKASDLPGLEALAYHNAAPVRSDPDFRRDTARLIESLQRMANLGAGVGAGRTAPPVPLPEPAVEKAAEPIAMATPPPVAATEPAAAATEPAAADGLVPPAARPAVTGTEQGQGRPAPDARLRLAAWLAGAGSIALFAARVPAFITYDWGSSRLQDAGTVSQGILVLALLAAAAAVSSFSSRNGPATGVTMLVGLLPPVAVTTLIFYAVLYYESKADEMQEVAAGYVLLQLGCALVLAACLLATTRVRRHLSRPDGAAKANAVPVAAAAALGLTAALIWAREFDEGDIWAGGHVAALVIIIAVLGLVRCVFSDWLRQHGVAGRLGAVVTVFAYGGAALEYLSVVTPTEGGHLLLIVALTAIVISITVVPILGILLRPRRRAALLVVVWAIGMLAANPDSWKANALLAVAVAGTAAVTLVQAARNPDETVAAGRGV